MKCAFHDDNNLDNYTKKETEDGLIHEHLFIESVNFYVSCFTCGESYCKRCGRLVKNQNTTIPQALVLASLVSC
jgi:hypothetical protein